MSCYSCGAAFGLFKKELGCKNCGYVYCKDCLSKKAPIPKLNNEKHKVCLKCFKILTGQAKPEEKSARYSPPEALKKRLAKLEENSTNPKPGSSHPAHSQRSSQPINTRGMSKEDIAIATRLQKLKDDRKKDTPPVPSEQEMRKRLDQLKKDPNAAPPPSEQEMSNRLAKLKGQDPSTTNKPHVFQYERRAMGQQVEDLLQEICDEVELDSHTTDPATDVQNRLDDYHGAPNQPDEYQNNLNSPSSKDNFQYTKNIPHVQSDYKPVSGEDVDWSEMNRLVTQVANEMDVDARKAIHGLKQDEELWDRLNKIKNRRKENKDDNAENPEPPDTSPDTQEGSVEVEEENEEDACKKIIKQLLEESRIEEEEEEAELTGRKLHSAPSVPSTTSNTQVEKGSDEFVPDPDELPYCCICNNNPSLRCMGCDGDLYCKRCYKEGHDREDYADHPTRAYKPGKS